MACFLFEAQAELFSWCSLCFWSKQWAWATCGFPTSTHVVLVTNKQQASKSCTSLFLDSTGQHRFNNVFDIVKPLKILRFNDISCTKIVWKTSAKSANFQKKKRHPCVRITADVLNDQAAESSAVSATIVPPLMWIFGRIFPKTKTTTGLSGIVTPSVTINNADTTCFFNWNFPPFLRIKVCF